MISLKPFTENDFEQFKSWKLTSRDLAIFAGPIFKLPVTDEQLMDYLNRTEIKPFKVVLDHGNEIIGHCELNYGHEIPRLSRILIASHSVRGKGIGQEIVSKLAEMAFNDDSVQMVDLNVFDFNVPAIKCYQKVGFLKNEVPTLKHQFREETWTRLNMVLTREGFLSRKKPL